MRQFFILTLIIGLLSFSLCLAAREMDWEDLSEPVTITCQEDGAKVIVKYVKTSYIVVAGRMFGNYTPTIVYNPCVVLCESGKHLLGFVGGHHDSRPIGWNEPIPIFSNNHDITLPEFTLEKSNAFSNVTTYKLTTVSNNEPPLPGGTLMPQFMTIWLDNTDKDEHCGGYNYLVPVYNEGYQYDKIKDMLLFEIESYLQNYRDFFMAVPPKGIWFPPNLDTEYALDIIRQFDEEIYEKISAQYRELANKRSDNAGFLATRVYLYYYTMLKSQVYEKSFIAFADEILNIPEELPTNQEELELYLNWIERKLRLVRQHNTPAGSMIDHYGTQIKFEVIPEGLKATSAGADKEFGTVDDYWIIRYPDGAFEMHPDYNCGLTP